MTELHFSLQPFPPTAALPGMRITGDITRHSNSLTVRYVLAGALEEIAVSAFSDTPVRKSGLWEQTCFELFLAVKSSDRYWEFNLSPAGHWNVYRFVTYRQGMAEETAFTSLRTRIRYDVDSLTLELKVDLDRVVRPDQSLEIGISAVIKQAGGGTAYWALTHCGPQADFHRRDSFLIEL